MSSLAGFLQRHVDVAMGVDANASPSHHHHHTGGEEATASKRGVTGHCHKGGESDAWDEWDGIYTNGSLYHEGGEGDEWDEEQETPGHAVRRQSSLASLSGFGGGRDTSDSEDENSLTQSGSFRSGMMTTSLLPPAHKQTFQQARARRQQHVRVADRGAKQHCREFTSTLWGMDGPFHPTPSFESYHQQTWRGRSLSQSTKRCHTARTHRKQEQQAEREHPQTPRKIRRRLFPFLFKSKSRGNPTSASTPVQAAGDSHIQHHQHPRRRLFYW